MLCGQHLGCIFCISTIQDGWGDKPVIRYVCCSVLWDGRHFIAKGGGRKGKRLVQSPPPILKKMCGETPLGRAMERQTCTKTTRQHAVTQVCSLQLLIGRHMSAVLYSFWITLAQSRNWVSKQWVIIELRYKVWDRRTEKGFKKLRR